MCHPFLFIVYCYRCIVRMIRKCIPYCHIFMFIFLSSCTSSKTIRHEFEFVLVKDDLKSIVNDTPKEHVIDTPYYDITLYEDKKQGKYSIIAVVDYYFYKKVFIKIQRKYRYDSYYKKWERYTNEYMYYK